MNNRLNGPTEREGGREEEKMVDDDVEDVLFFPRRIGHDKRKEKSKVRERKEAGQ